MRQNLIPVFLILFIFLLPNTALSKDVKFAPKIYLDLPSVGIVMPRTGGIKPALTVMGFHTTFFKSEKCNFLGLGVSYNWVNKLKVNGKDGFYEGASVSIPFSFQLGKKEDDDSGYITISYNYSPNASVGGHGLFVGFSVGSR